MSDTTISELPLATYVTPSDFIVFDRGDRTYKIQLNAINGFAGLNVVYVSPAGSDFFNSGTAVTAPFKTIKKALKYINDNPSSNGYVLYLNAGEYIEKNPLVLPRKTTLIGENEKRVILKPENPEYDMVWINDGCYVGGITFKGNLYPSSAIAYPKFISPSVDILNVTDDEYVRAYYVLGFEMDRPLDIPTFLVEPKIECVSFNINALKSPIQINVGQSFDNSKTANSDSYNMFQKLYDNSLEVINYGITATKMLEPFVVSQSPAFQEVINYLQNKRNYYENDDDIFSIRPYVFQNFGIDLFQSSLVDNFYRDVKIVLNSLIYDISANSNRLILEAGKTYYNNISSLILPNDNNPSTKQIILSTLNYIYGVIEYEVFQDVPNTPGTIRYFVNNQFTDIKNYLNGNSVLFSPTTSLSTSYINTALLLSSNRQFILEEAYAYAESSDYEVLRKDYLDEYKKEINFMVDSFVYDLSGNTNSQSIHYSNLLYNKLSSSNVLIKNLMLDTFKYVGDISKKVILNSPVSALSLDCGDAVRVDGSLLKGLYKRNLHINDFNAIVEGGKGVWVKNNGSVMLNNGLFTCCTQGILCESGGKCISDSCTNMFGLTGLASIGNSPVPILSALTLNQVFPLTSDSIDITNITSTAIYGLTSNNNKLSNYPSQGMIVEFVINNNPLSAIRLPILDQPIKITDSQYRIVLPKNIPVNIPASTKTNFFFRSTIIADSHNFDYVGCGTVLKKSIPSLGGITVKDLEVVYDTTDEYPSGIVYFKSIDQNGNVSFGKDFVISQENNRIEGYTFDRSVISLFTPFAIAME